MKTVCSALMWLSLLSAGAAFAQPEGNPASSPAAVPESPEAVITLAGDRITGRVTAIGKDGFLRLANPNFERDIAVRVSALARVTFSPTAEEMMPHTVRLTGGGALAGRVRAISPTEVVVESSVAGKVTVSRAFVEEIRFAPAKGGAPSVEFAAGEIEPFKDVSGDKTRQPGAGLSGRVQLVAEYQQDKPITVVLDFVEGNPLFSVGMFVADWKNPDANSLVLRWTGDGVYLFGNHTPTGSWSTGLNPEVAKNGLRNARVCCDPVKGDTMLWINGKLIPKPGGLGGPKTGRYITINCPDRMALGRIQVLEGVIAPGEDDKAASGVVAAKADRDTILLANGDTLNAESVGLANGVVSVKSELADMAIPAERISAVIFRRAARKAPEANPRSVLVHTARSAFILDTIEMNDTSVVGACAALGGEARIDRAAVKMIRFAADPKPPSASTAEMSPWTVTPPAVVPADRPPAAAPAERPAETPEQVLEKLRLERLRLQRLKEMNR